MSRAAAIHWMKPGVSAVWTASANMKVVWALLKESGLAWIQDNAASAGISIRPRL